MFILCGQLTYHINGIFVALAYFCVSGIFAIALLLKKRPLQIGFGVVLACLYAVTFVGFAREYYFADTTVTYQVYGGTDEALSLLNDEQQQKEIYFLDEVDVYYFMVNPIPPDEFATHSDEMGYVKDYNNLHFYKLNKNAEYGSVATFDLDGYTLSAASENPCEEFDLFYQSEE